MRVALPEAAELAPSVEEEYRCEAQWAAEELSLAADRVLREICGSDLRPIAVAPVELVEVFVASMSSMFRLNRFCLPCALLSTATGTTPRLQ